MLNDLVAGLGNPKLLELIFSLSYSVNSGLANLVATTPSLLPLTLTFLKLGNAINIPYESLMTNWILLKLVSGN